MKLKILYHSGAGATRTIAEVYHQLLGCSDCSLEAVTPNFQYSSLSDLDILVFGFPTYHCAPSRTAREFIERMPAFTKPVRFFVFTAFSLCSGNSIRNLVRAAAAKNLVLCGYGSYRSPSSDRSLFLPYMDSMYHFGVSVPKQIRHDVMKIRSILLGHPAVRIRKPVFKAYTLLNFPLSFFGRRRKFRFTILPERCIQCGRCQSSCVRSCWEETETGPAVNYSNCESCFKCVHHCPASAIIIFSGSIDKKKLSIPYYMSLKRGLLA